MSATDSAVQNARPPRHWEDLEIGEATRSRVLCVKLEEMLAYSRHYDPQWFHANEQAARDSLFGAVIASGLYTASLWRLLDHEENGDIAWVCGVAWENVRWRKAVYAGDQLCAHSEILSKRASASRPGLGIAILAHKLTNQKGEIVFDFTSTDLVYRRGGQAEPVAQ
ncbi:dehydratase [Rhodophyticola sp. CCM32]|uniref:MaoC/PaaZ C-terminal domain-containing protein n=1 Tax=Rhodophyticola sp. CCM32 TaxID=2916397 RepID=UPI00107F4C98|nr:MaoC/PaaZ C-terminal domain-containing protein [Rhodophyticola sp. CCM32]QBY00034.1 dehydratase [Rhodophyticola sp. CCM32]